MDDRTFRTAMGKFVTGVTVITTETKDDIHGMTANAFMSVSLSPKLITVSIDNRANMLEKIKESKKFAVNILSDRQKDLSMHFAGQVEIDREIEFGYLSGVPILEGAIVSVACELDNSFVVGDHTLFIGKVIEIKMSEGNPLIFYSGQYGINSSVS